MALSGSVTTNGYDGRKYTVSWTATQSVPNNTSTISYSVSCAGSNSGAHWYAERTLQVVIAGTTVINKTERVQREAGVFHTGTVTVQHANDGTKTFSISIKVAIYDVYVNATGSGTFTLNTIARASTILSTPVGFFVGNLLNVKWKPASTSFKYKIKVTCGSWSGMTDYISPNTTDEYVYQLDTDTLMDDGDSLLNYSTSSPTVSIVISLYTYSGSTQIGNASSINVELNIPTGTEYYPKINSSSFTLVNNNSVINGWNVAVAGYSSMKIEASASGVFNSTIISYDISGSYNTSISGNPLVYDGAVLTTSGTKTFSVVAVDSRGRTSSPVSNTITVYGYSKPSVSNIIVTRQSSNPKVVYVKASWTWATVNNKNTATCTLKYRKHNTVAWTTYGTLQNGYDTKLTTAFDEYSSYDFKITVTDALGNYATADASISTQRVTLDGRAGGKGLGIGKVSEYDMMEVAMPSLFYDSSEFQSPVVFDSSSSFVGEITMDSFAKSFRDDIAFWQHRNDTGVGVGFGVGSAGINRGIYDEKFDDWILCRNSATSKTNEINGDTTIHGNLYADNIEYSGYKTDITNKTIVSGTDWITVGELNSSVLPVGIIYLEVVVRFDYSESGRRQLDIAYLNGVLNEVHNLGIGWTDYRNAVTGNYAYCRVSGVVNTKKYTDMYIRVKQNSGSSLGCVIRYTYFRFI